MTTPLSRDEREQADMEALRLTQRYGATARRVLLEQMKHAPIEELAFLYLVDDRIPD